MVEVSVEWAHWGKHPRSHEDYAVLATSDGILGRDALAATVEHYATGNFRTSGTPHPGQLPRINIGPVIVGPDTFLTFAVTQWSGHNDAAGRPAASKSLFAVHHGHAEPVSYTGLLHAVRDIALPDAPSADASPLKLAIPSFDPEAMAQRVGESGAEHVALTAAGLLQRRVDILGGDGTTYLERLEYLDAVAALLPYGFRMRLAAATWAESSHHSTHLTFAASARESRLPLTGYAAQYLRELNGVINDSGRLTGLIARLAEDRTPRAYTPGDHGSGKDALGGLRRALTAPPPRRSPPPPKPAPAVVPVEKVRKKPVPAVEAVEEFDAAAIADALAPGSS